jgi:hypothetical protein
MWAMSIVLRVFKQFELKTPKKMDAVQNNNSGGGYIQSSGASRFDPVREI